jgi:hypothetical protein
VGPRWPKTHRNCVGRATTVNRPARYYHHAQTSLFFYLGFAYAPNNYEDEMQMEEEKYIQLRRTQGRGVRQGRFLLCGDW